MDNKIKLEILAIGDEIQELEDKIEVLKKARVEKYRILIKG